MNKWLHFTCTRSRIYLINYTVSIWPRLKSACQRKTNGIDRETQPQPNNNECMEITRFSQNNIGEPKIWTQVLKKMFQWFINSVTYLTRNFNEAICLDHTLHTTPKFIDYAFCAHNEKRTVERTWIINFYSHSPAYERHQQHEAVIQRQFPNYPCFLVFATSV